MKQIKHNKTGWVVCWKSGAMLSADLEEERMLIWLTSPPVFLRKQDAKEFMEIRIRDIEERWGPLEDGDVKNS